MNYMKNIGLMFGLLIGIHAYSGVISLSSLVQKKSDEAVVRKAILEYIQKHPKVVFYFGIENCKSCTTTKAAITKLLSQFPDVMFVLVDLAQYKYLKAGSWPRLKFHKNSIVLEETTRPVTMPELKALLNTYYR
jgi:hypothetical protein